MSGTRTAGWSRPGLPMSTTSATLRNLGGRCFPELARSLPTGRPEKSLCEAQPVPSPWPGSLVSAGGARSRLSDAELEKLRRFPEPTLRRSTKGHRAVCGSARWRLASAMSPLFWLGRNQAPAQCGEYPLSSAEVGEVPAHISLAIFLRARYVRFARTAARCSFAVASM